MKRIEHRTLPLDDPGSIHPARARDLFDHWCLYYRPGNPPRRQDLDMAALRPVMDNVALVWVSLEPLLVTYRIVGAALVRLLGEDPTGRSAGDVYHPEIAAEVTETLGSALRSGRPSFDVREFRFMGITAGYSRLVLPLALESPEGGYVVVCIHPTQKWLQKAQDWKTIFAPRTRGASPATDDPQGQDWTDEDSEANTEIAYL